MQIIIAFLISSAFANPAIDRIKRAHPVYLLERCGVKNVNIDMFLENASPSMIECLELKIPEVKKFVEDLEGKKLKRYQAIARMENVDCDKINDKMVSDICIIMQIGR